MARIAWSNKFLELDGGDGMASLIMSMCKPGDFVAKVGITGMPPFVIGRLMAHVGGEGFTLGAPLPQDVIGGLGAPLPKLVPE